MAGSSTAATLVSAQTERVNNIFRTILITRLASMCFDTAFRADVERWVAAVTVSNVLLPGLRTSSETQQLLYLALYLLLPFPAYQSQSRLQLGLFQWIQEVTLANSR